MECAVIAHLSLPSTLSVYFIYLFLSKYHPSVHPAGAYTTWQLHMVQKTWLQFSIIPICGEEILAKYHRCSHYNILCSQILQLWILSARLSRRNMLSGFKKPKCSCHLETAQLWIIQPSESHGTGGSSQFSPFSTEALDVCSWLAFAVKMSRVIPAVKAFLYRFTLSSFPWNLQYSPAVSFSSSFYGCERGSGAFCF